MKKIIFALIIGATLESCSKEEPVAPQILVKETCCAPVYYAEILHAQLYKVGDTVRIQYNQMPRHERAYPNKLRHGYTTVVIVKR
jgi:hypothetical protein